MIIHVYRCSIKRIGKLAWDAIKTDFTEAEQEERRLLLSKVKSKRRLDASERKRLDDLNAEHKKKSESRSGLARAASPSRPWVLRLACPCAVRSAITCVACAECC